MNALTTLIERVDNLTIRERAAILLGILAVLYTAWNLFLMQPLQNQQKIIKSELQQKQATQVALNAQVQKIVEENKRDPNVELEKELKDLQAKLKQANDEIKVSTAHLVSPKNMAKILETILNKTNGLTLVSAKGLGATALLQDDKKVQDDKKKDSVGKSGKNEQATAQVTEPPPGDMGNAYKHGLRIEFEGDYMTTLHYLHELESLDWKFFWDSIELKVEEYPRARVAIQVFTLSLDKNWIDV